MSKLFKSTAKSQKPKRIKTRQERYWASDAVERIARRTPALFKRNPVPSIGSKSFTFHNTQQGGMI